MGFNIMSIKQIGHGNSYASKIKVTGEVKYVHDIHDVVTLLKTNPRGKICLTEHSNVTFLGPIFNKIAGILCMTGSRNSHLAIMAREFEIPAFMSCKFDLPLEELDQTIVTLLTNSDGVTGEIFLHVSEN